MKIYFAGSIRGGREDVVYYHAIIDHLKKQCEVLTEHVSDKALSELGESTLTDDEIFQRDLEWLRESDALVAEVTNPSLGVGYEIAFAENMDKPVICMFRELSGKKLSAMIAGNPSVAKMTYTNMYDFQTTLDELIARV